MQLLLCSENGSERQFVNIEQGLSGIVLTFETGSEIFVELQDNGVPRAYVYANRSETPTSEVEIP